MAVTPKTTMQAEANARMDRRERSTWNVFTFVISEGSSRSLQQTGSEVRRCIGRATRVSPVRGDVLTTGADGVLAVAQIDGPAGPNGARGQGESQLGRRVSEGHE